MVVSMNRSEGGPLRIYPCTSEVESFTQGKKRFLVCSHLCLFLVFVLKNP